MCNKKKKKKKINVSYHFGIASASLHNFWWETDVVVLSKRQQLSLYCSDFLCDNDECQWRVYWERKRPQFCDFESSQTSWCLPGKLKKLSVRCCVPLYLYVHISPASSHSPPGWRIQRLLGVWRRPNSPFLLLLLVIFHVWPDLLGKPLVLPELGFCISCSPSCVRLCVRGGKEKRKRVIISGTNSKQARGSAITICGLLRRAEEASLHLSPPSLFFEAPLLIIFSPEVLIQGRFWCHTWQPYLGDTANVFFPSRLKQEQSDTVRPGSVFTKLPDAKGCS